MKAHLHRSLRLGDKKVWVSAPASALRRDRAKRKRRLNPVAGFSRATQQLFQRLLALIRVCVLVYFPCEREALRSCGKLLAILVRIALEEIVFQFPRRGGDTRLFIFFFSFSDMPRARPHSRAERERCKFPRCRVAIRRLRALISSASRARLDVTSSDQNGAFRGNNKILLIPFSRRFSALSSHWNTHSRQLVKISRDDSLLITRPRCC